MFLGCDGADPIALERMMEATRASGVLGTAWECTFTGEREEGAPVGKGPGDCSRTRERTGWQPKFTSFDDFMTNGKVRPVGALAGRECRPGLTDSRRWCRRRGTARRPARIATTP